MDPWEVCLVRKRASDKVENGVSYEKVEFDFSPYKEIVLPDDALAHLSDPGTKPVIYVEKHQDYHGDPPRPMEIANNRRDMGLAYMVSEQSIAFATFGSWETDGGGGSLKVHFKLPAGVKVSKMDRLSGLDSRANLTPEGKVGPAFGGASAGWTPIATLPDLSLGGTVR